MITDIFTSTLSKREIFDIIYDCTLNNSEDSPYTSFAYEYVDNSSKKYIGYSL